MVLSRRKLKSPRTNGVSPGIPALGVEKTNPVAELQTNFMGEGLGKFIGYAVSALALVTIGFTAGMQWATRSRPGIIWQHPPVLDDQWEFIDAGGVDLFVSQLNDARPKPEHIIPVCGNGIYRVWCRKDHADIQYKASSTKQYFDRPDVVKGVLTDPNRVLIGFSSGPALYYLEIVPKAEK